MEIENWKSFFDRYEVSDLGRIRNSETGRLLKLMQGSNGYNRILFCQKGQKHRFAISRLVAKTFIGPPSGIRNEVDHINRIKQTTEYVIYGGLRILKIRSIDIA